MEHEHPKPQQHNAVDALLASLAQDALPTPAERKQLRRAARLTQAQVAQALGVSRETVSAWETGRWEPTGTTRTHYQRLLNGLRTHLTTPTPNTDTPDTPTPPQQQPTPQPPETDPHRLTTPAPCVLCNQPATHQIEGYPQHLDPADCTPLTPPTTPHP
ncbi:helix-turn-helix transcriptional regulator, partial [Streptomyces thermospinosisporus]|uniref:helix-turn-helix transcriptional regulator n=1 Tax=Streptomyces thermospinosisporus TaxID=161482 RepID=UPI0031D56AC1